jgi:membrane-associated phospholipid phosphatase
LRKFTIPALIIVLGALVFCGVSQVEAPLVYEFWQKPVPWFRDFMAQSLFEGEAFGGSDFGVLFAVSCFVVWLVQRRAAVRSCWLSLAELRFIWLSGFWVSIVAVQSLKWMVSRARPKIFLKPEVLGADPVAFLTQLRWAGFMPIDGPRGLQFNSFPSGHTAACAILLTASYVFWRRRRSLSFALFFIIALLSSLMAIARCMAGMHWISDSIASFFMTWALIHAIYIEYGAE